MSNLSHSSADLCPQILDSLDDHVALVDSSGMIVRVNAAWEKFSMQNGGVHSRTGVGRNYFEVCEQAFREGVLEAGQFLQNLRSTLHAGGSHEVLYPCHSPQEKRWFSVKAVGLRSQGQSFATVIHSNFTARTLLQERLIRLTQEMQEARRRMLLQEWTIFLADELRKPLNTISLRAQLLRRMIRTSDRPDPKYLEACSSIVEIAHSAIELFESAEAKMDQKTHEKERLRVREVLEDTIAIAKGCHGISGQVVTLDGIDETLLVEARRVHVNLALVSLLLYLSRNARGPIGVRVQKEGDWLKLCLWANVGLHDSVSETEFRLAKKLAYAESGRIQRRTADQVEQVELRLPSAVENSDFLTDRLAS